jgi:ribosomal protein S18 acetylase RimI-like enzyme
VTRLVVLDGDGFAPYVDPSVEVYIAAMGKPRSLVPARRAITGRHLNHDGLRAVVALNDDGGLIGFAYGYNGQPGQWWHDAVAEALDDDRRETWLSRSFELAELHVLPAWQGQGLGRQLLTTAGHVDRSTLVLSAVDEETVARHLYRSMGFIDLLTGFTFPGSGEAYAVMGRPLPLSSA